jgi:hypothetical protein
MIRKAIIAACLGIAIVAVALELIAGQANRIWDLVPTSRSYFAVRLAEGDVEACLHRYTQPHSFVGKKRILFRDACRRAGFTTLPREGHRFKSPWSWHLHRFAFVGQENVGSFRVSFLRFPLWAALSVSLLYPAIAFVRGPFRRYRRRKKGQCVKCGYDLTGNVSGRCPECGERI